jgi:predicted esterase
MSVSVQYLKTQKTARIFTQGELSNQTKFVWFILHGYAQTAEHLLNSFNELGDEHFVIAPEGLNHFYSKGFTGLPVASWMTSLMREEEILDYVSYLDLVYQNFTIPTNCKIVVLGFSQGVSTLCRWIHRGLIKPNHIVFVAGNIAHEMQENIPESILSIRNIYLYGSNDSLVSKESIMNAKSKFNSNTNFIEFEGKHELNLDCLEKIQSWLKSQ